MEFLSDVMFWREAVTVFCFGLFLLICKWAYSSKAQPGFEQASLQLFQDDDAAVNQEVQK